jgi:hypothetical protein
MSQAEADCYRKQHDWYNESMVAVQSNIKHIHTAHMELHNIQTRQDIETIPTSPSDTNLLSALKHDNLGDTDDITQHLPSNVGCQMYSYPTVISLKKEKKLETTMSKSLSYIQRHM